ncbi:MAG TPA: hypothetical protein VJL59_18615 [Anaerolineales bacterium]|nr:hypothetical protein [Anaerolineales bacterium]
MPHDEFVDEDPLGLVGMVLPGEPGQLEAMAECFVEEYARMGWDERRLMTLFVSPVFLATHRIYRQKGEEYVRELIRRTCAKWGMAIRPEATTQLLPVTPPCETPDRL